MARIANMAPAIFMLLALATSTAAARGIVRAVSTPTVTINSGPSCTESPIVVPNGDFESGSLSPWNQVTRPVPGGAPSTIDIVEGGYNSDHAVQLSVGYVARLNQSDIPTCEATSYTVSFAYKVLSASETCEIQAKAGGSRATTITYGTTVSPLMPGDWTTTTFQYQVSEAQLYYLSLGVVCRYQGTSATVLLDDVQVKATGSIAGPGCPNPDVGLVNGGFDDGQFAPWTPSQANDGYNSPRITVISPGYNSQYALQLDFATTNVTYWFFEQNFGNMCNGYEYQVSFAVNWANYTGVPGGFDHGCELSVGPNGCIPSGTEQKYYSVNTPGWQEFSYTCTSIADGASFMAVVLNCAETNPIPAWTVQFDDINFELLPPTPAAARRSAAKDITAIRGALRKDHFGRGRDEPRWV